jgi:hypothetical protein
VIPVILTVHPSQLRHVLDYGIVQREFPAVAQLHDGDGRQRLGDGGPMENCVPSTGWLYFRRLEARGFTVWRVHPDGSGLERVASWSGPAVAE